MSLAGEILSAWRQGWGNRLRQQIDAGAGEERALGWLMFATVLLVIGQLPASYRAALASVDDSSQVPIAVTMSAVFMLFLAPLSFYAIAALGHFLARMLGATGPFLNARLGLFWALLCFSPLSLLASALGNALGPDVANILQSLLLFAFLAIWADTMSVAESLKSRLQAGLALGAIGVSLLLVQSALPG